MKSLAGYREKNEIPLYIIVLAVHGEIIRKMYSSIPRMPEFYRIKQPEELQYMVLAFVKIANEEKKGE